MSGEAKVLIGISVVTLVLVVGAALLFGGKSSNSSQNNKPISNPQDLMHSDSHVVKATDKNSVTLVEFGDFQCPACGAAYPIVEQLRAEYKGKITYVFRNFPLTAVHQNAMKAAEAAEAAGAQGKFFDMYNLLYTNQGKWGETNNAESYFLDYAKQLNLDVTKFKDDVDHNKYEKKIQKDMEDGNAVGVNATPTFFINGVMLNNGGGLPYADFKAKIDEALKNSSK